MPDSAEHAASDLKTLTKIPATVITGFLGAGKTSLIKHIVEHAGGRRLALIINEFGDIGVDAGILDGCKDPDCELEEVVELANGCICCTVADDFLPTLQALVDRENPPEHIIIETSGLALPKPLVRAFNWPEIKTRVTVDGVLAVIDGRAVADGLFAHDPVAVQDQRESDEMLDHESPLEEVFEEQVACADLVVLNKVDLLDEVSKAGAMARVAEEMRPGVQVIGTAQGAVDPAVLLGLGAGAEDDLDSRHSHHDHGEDHEHDDFESFHVNVAPVAHPDDLIAKLKPVIEAHGILRVKGFVAVEGKPMRCLIQGVGARLQSYYDRDWVEDEDRQGRLVVIGLHGLDKAVIAETLAG
ncbi:MAG: cobalamin biosynthesis protein CobW [Magnetovibrionaceae bacterium]